MIARYLKPHRALRNYIRHYVYCEIGSEGTWAQSSMAPPGCAKLSITLRKDFITVRENTEKEARYEPVIFVGQITRYKSLAWRDKLHLFLVIFQPFGAFPLLGIPQDECQNKCMELSEIMGSYVSGMAERLSDNEELDEMLNIVDRFS